MSTKDDSTKDRPVIIIVEDDQLLGISLKKYLKKNLQCDTYLYQSSEDFLLDLGTLDLKSKNFCLVTDISLGRGSDGLLLIDILQEKKFSFVSLVMTGFASIETAISATKKGVYHYLTKPFDLAHLEKLIKEIFVTKFDFLGNQVVSMSDECSNFEVSLSDKKRNENILLKEFIGHSSQIKNVRSLIQKISMSDTSVLITGESGVGKELVSSLIHQLSPRKTFPFFSIKCQGIPSDVLEQELFGENQTEFNHIVSDRRGKMILAHHGTLYIDGISELSHQDQIRLLKVIREKKVELKWSHQTIVCDVRIIASSDKNLEDMVLKGEFREDLFYQLNITPLHVPSLKERREDIPLFISYFLNKFVSANQSNQINFTSQAMELLQSYNWPGNVRELENLIQRLIVLRGGHQILPEDLPAKIFKTNPLKSHDFKNLLELPDTGVDLKKILSEIEDSLIEQALNLAGGNKNKASKLLSLNRTTLIEKLKKKTPPSPSSDLS